MSPHVHISLVNRYDIALIRRELQTALDALGGLAVKNGDKVLLKPNLLAPRSPEKAVTTHPAVVQAVIELVLDCGGKPFIGDSPGVSASAGLWRETGMSELAEKFDIELINFNSQPLTEYEIRGNRYYLSRTALECDLMINLPKLKTHALTLYTGAVKNMFGCLPGFQKGIWHRRAPKSDQFSQVVVDIFSAFKPGINIMDGITAMEGEGPSNGKARDVGVLIASDDAPALDAIASGIIGFKREEVFTTVFAQARGFSPGLDDTVLTGSNPQDIIIPDFRLPNNRFIRLIPKLAHDLLGKYIWSKPEIDRNICSQCYECISACPAQAMSVNSGPPAIDYKKCIECYCCDEVCPEGAVKKKLSWLAKKLM
ncbi:DUF362 domain-containing protein [bacterium]|nr:DUF362 domain-containing protein [FCB group bacterium]MBL7191387.1 DUF362 domain-containing protein [bacterium]